MTISLYDCIQSKGNASLSDYPRLIYFIIVVNTNRICLWRMKILLHICAFRHKKEECAEMLLSVECDTLVQWEEEEGKVDKDRVKKHTD